MEMSDLNNKQGGNICKYRNKRIVKEIDDIHEFIKTYPHTNEELNNYFIKKDRQNSVSPFKRFIFYILTQIASILAVCIIIFCVGFLIGNNISSKSSIINSISNSYYLSNNIGAVLIIGKPSTQNTDSSNDVNNVLTLNMMINFNFNYNNIFMGTLISKVLLHYYPANAIKLNPNEYCYNVYNSNIINDGIRKHKTDFGKNSDDYISFLQDESLIFLNYSIKENRNIKITYINDLLFSKLTSYPIAGSDITVSPGIMHGISSINTLISVNYIIKDTNIQDNLLNDCKLGRIYLRLDLVDPRIKTMFFRFTPQIGTFLPFKIPCEIKNGKTVTNENKEFRDNLIKQHKMQRSAIKNISLFMN
ncbi:conserved Plasmodium protein, unknown function [Plasmodium chabaudi adami]|uniref:Uncharacterized protein n=1 Tax=Plasmodium chabaudi adami TaxID=5826 RepID=A0A1C6YJA6_PLACE|nr:conserved Plasmodium protein, unknown function [Plasmodium chabaudi adami]